jgi:hypothetical protein
VLEADGTVIIDGDQATECYSFAVGREQGYDSGGDQELARAVLEECERAGFSSSNRGDMEVGNSEVVVGAPGAEPPSSPGGTHDPAAAADDGSEVLPETSGGLLLPLAAAGLALVAAAGLFAHRHGSSR